MKVINLFSWLNQADKTQKQAPASFYQSIYPESVRYALQYKEAQMGKGEIRALIDKWTFEAVYLVVKAVAYDRETQRQFLEDLTCLYYQVDWEMPELSALLTHYVELLPDDLTVTGTKLAQLSRTGGETWQSEWRQLAQSIATEKFNTLPCLIANTPMYGYHHFIEVYRRQKQDKLLLLMPDWILNPDETQMGYEITLSDPPTVNLQVKDDCLYGTWACEGLNCKLKQHFCKEAIFIDDTINSGKTAGKLQSFWLSEYGLNMPLDRVRVITNLRENDNAPKRVKK